MSVYPVSVKQLFHRGYLVNRPDTFAEGKIKILSCTLENEAGTVADNAAI